MLIAWGPSRCVRGYVIKSGVHQKKRQTGANCVCVSVLFATKPSFCSKDFFAIVNTLGFHTRYLYRSSFKADVHKFFQKSVSPLEIVCTRSVTRTKFCNENSQILGATVQNLVARLTWR